MPDRPLSLVADGGQQGAPFDGAGQDDGMRTRAARVAAAVALLALPLLGPGMPPPVARAEGSAGVMPDRAAQLLHILTQDCGSCHGLTMKDGLGRPLTPDALSHATPAGLAHIILDGIPGTAMPPWRPLLSETDALWMAARLLEHTP